MRNMTVVTTGATSSSVQSSWIYIGNMTKLSIMSKVTGDSTAAGTVKLLVSNDPGNGGGSMMPYTPVSYIALATPQLTVAGNTVVAATPFDIAYQWLQVSYERSAGTGGVITIEVSGHD